MNVLFIGSVYARCQTDDQVPWMRGSVRQLRAAGVEVEILAPSHCGLKSHTIDGVAVHRFRYGPAAWETLTGEEGAPSKLKRNPWLKLLALSYLWNGFWAVANLLSKKKYDLIEVHWPWPHALMALPAIVSGVPVIYHYHSAELKLANAGAFSRTVFAKAIGWAKAHIANSSYTAALVKKFRPNATVEVIPYGAPMTMEACSPKSGPRRKILFVGRHIERKGLPYLIEAFKTLPADYSLTIVGQGDQTEALKTLAAKDERIRFLGRLSTQDLAKAYAGADVFVLPAIVDSKGDTEGLGVVLIEAIAAGVPIVATNVGGIPDVVTHEKTGLLVEEKNATALAEAIKRIGTDEALASKLIANAQTHAKEFFDWQNITQKTLAVYKSVLKH